MPLQLADDARRPPSRVPAWRRPRHQRAGIHRGRTPGARWFAELGLDRERWDSPLPDGESPEAEWGFEEALLADVLQFAAAQRYRIIRITFGEPEHPSPLVADLHRWWYRARGLPANRLVVDSFLLMDPWWTLRLGAVPF